MTCKKRSKMVGKEKLEKGILLLSYPHKDFQQKNA